MKLSKIFEEKPERWGFRGDPYFWNYLKELAENMDIISPDELEKWIKKEYLSLAGKPLTNEYGDFAVVEQFAHGRMSSGGVDNESWMNEGIPVHFMNRDTGHITIEGEQMMEYKIEKWEAMDLLVHTRDFQTETSEAEIPIQA